MINLLTGQILKIKFCTMKRVFSVLRICPTKRMIIQKSWKIPIGMIQSGKTGTRLHAEFKAEQRTAEVHQSLKRRETSLTNYLCVQSMQVITYCYCSVTDRIADPHWFNADPDPDPAFFLVANPKTGSGSSIFSSFRSRFQIRIPNLDPRLKT